MSISNLPSNLNAIIQQGFLQREFEEGLQSVLTYRSIADRTTFPNQIGETFTRTRNGLKAPVTTPLNPSQNTNLDNGLTPSSFTVEQYTMTLNEWADTTDLNLLGQRTTIENLFLYNARMNAIQAMQSLNRIAQSALFNAYLSGNTRVTATLGSPGTTIAVDDIRGFRNVMVNGVITPVSVSNTMSVSVNGTSYILTGFAADTTNVSTAVSSGGISGTLTFSTNVSVANGTTGNAVVGQFAPTIIRPSARATTAALTTTDLIKMSDIIDAVTVLRNNAVPSFGGQYHCYLDYSSMRQIYADDDFKFLFRSQYDSDEYRNLRIIDLLDVRFIATTEAYQQTNGAVKIRRPIVCGEGVLIEGTFQGMRESLQDGINSGEVSIIEDIAQITRSKLDRLQEIVSQSWKWVGGYAVPTDQTANQNIIPTANNAYFKRAVVIEHGGT